MTVMVKIVQESCTILRSCTILLHLALFFLYIVYTTNVTLHSDSTTTLRARVQITPSNTTTTPHKSHLQTLQCSSNSSSSSDSGSVVQSVVTKYSLCLVRRSVHMWCSSNYYYRVAVNQWWRAACCRCTSVHNILMTKSNVCCVDCV